MDGSVFEPSFSMYDPDRFLFLARSYVEVDDPGGSLCEEGGAMFQV